MGREAIVIDKTKDGGCERGDATYIVMYRIGRVTLSDRFGFITARRRASNAGGRRHELSLVLLSPRKTVPLKPRRHLFQRQRLTQELTTSVVENETPAAAATTFRRGDGAGKPPSLQSLAAPGFPSAAP